MLLRRFSAAAAGLFALAGPVWGQPVTLAETPRPGDCSRYQVELHLSGTMTFNVGDRKDSLKLRASARHTFSDRTLAVDGRLPAKSARFYAEARAKSAAGPNEFERSLPDDRRLLVAERAAGGLLCYSPAGPLTRDELDVAAEHFNPHCLPGLLPGKAVNVGDTWKLDDATAQAAGLFDALLKNDLTGTLTAVENGTAVFTVFGTAEGVENGAGVKLEVNATGRFDPASGRVTELKWGQKDVRAEGPVNPACEVEATVTLKREVLSAVPTVLDDAAVAAVPAGEPPALLTHLRHTDPSGRYKLLYPRDWHVTGQTGDHLILRLLDRGEFLAQATVTRWKPAAAGAHAAPDEFKKTLAAIPGWQPAEVAEDGSLPTDPGRWLYRLVVGGKLDGRPVVQAFHLLAGPDGRQVAVTVVASPDKFKAVGTRDVALVNAVDFPAGK